MPNNLSPLLSALAELFASENRPGGTEAAATLRDCAALSTQLPEAPAGPLDHHLTKMLAGDPHALSPLIRDAEPWLVWIFSELKGRIRSEIASGMMQCELAGPDGIFKRPNIRVGLWVQAPDLNYTTRSHAAEETFFILGGSAIWKAGDAPEIEAGCGEIVHHPSFTPHSDCTQNTPLLAAWRWSGDISIEQYTLKG